MTVAAERFESTVENLARLYRAAIAADPLEADQIATDFVRGDRGWHTTCKAFAKIAGETYPQTTTDERG